MKRVGFPLALAVFATVWLVPLTGLDTLTRQTLALLFATIVLWITRPFMPAVTGMPGRPWPRVRTVRSGRRVESEYRDQEKRDP